MNPWREGDRLGTKYPQGEEPKPLINQGSTIPEVCDTVVVGLTRLCLQAKSHDIADPSDADRMIRLAHALSDELFAVAEQLERWHDRALDGEPFLNTRVSALEGEPAPKLPEDTVEKLFKIPKEKETK